MDSEKSFGKKPAITNKRSSDDDERTASKRAKSSHANLSSVLGKEHYSLDHIKTIIDKFIISKNFENKAVANFDINFDEPEKIAKVLADPKNKGKIFVSCYGKGSNHWVPIIINLKEDKYQVIYLDPLGEGRSESLKKGLKSEIKEKTGKKARFIWNNMNMQQKDFNCGPISVEIITNFIRNGPQDTELVEFIKLMPNSEEHWGKVREKHNKIIQPYERGLSSSFSNDLNSGSNSQSSSGLPSAALTKKRKAESTETTKTTKTTEKAKKAKKTKTAKTTEKAGEGNPLNPDGIAGDNLNKELHDRRDKIILELKGKIKNYPQYEENESLDNESLDNDKLKYFLYKIFIKNLEKCDVTLAMTHAKNTYNQAYKEVHSEDDRNKYLSEKQQEFEEGMRALLCKAEKFSTDDFPERFLERNHFNRNVDHDPGLEPVPVPDRGPDNDPEYDSKYDPDNDYAEEFIKYEQEYQQEYDPPNHEFVALYIYELLMAGLARNNITSIFIDGGLYLSATDYRDASSVAGIDQLIKASVSSAYSKGGNKEGFSLRRAAESAHEIQDWCETIFEDKKEASKLFSSVTSSYCTKGLEEAKGPSEELFKWCKEIYRGNVDKAKNLFTSVANAYANHGLEGAKQASEELFKWCKEVCKDDLIQAKRLFTSVTSAYGRQSLKKMKNGVVVSALDGAQELLKWCQTKTKEDMGASISLFTSVAGANARKGLDKKKIELADVIFKWCLEECQEDLSKAKNLFSSITGAYSTRGLNKAHMPSKKLFKWCKGKHPEDIDAAISLFSSVTGLYRAKGLDDKVVEVVERVFVFCLEECEGDSSKASKLFSTVAGSYFGQDLKEIDTEIKDILQWCKETNGKEQATNLFSAIATAYHNKGLKSSLAPSKKLFEWCKATCEGAQKKDKNLFSVIAYCHYEKGLEGVKATSEKVFKWCKTVCEGKSENAINLLYSIAIAYAPNKGLKSAIPESEDLFEWCKEIYPENLDEAISLFSSIAGPCSSNSKGLEGAKSAAKGLFEWCKKIYPEDVDKAAILFKSIANTYYRKGLEGAELVAKNLFQCCKTTCKDDSIQAKSLFSSVMVAYYRQSLSGAELATKDLFKWCEEIYPENLNKANSLFSSIANAYHRKGLKGAKSASVKLFKWCEEKYPEDPNKAKAISLFSSVAEAYHGEGLEALNKIKDNFEGCKKILVSNNNEHVIFKLLLKGFRFRVTKKLITGVKSFLDDNKSASPELSPNTKTEFLEITMQKKQFSSIANTTTKKQVLALLVISAVKKLNSSNENIKSSAKKFIDVASMDTIDDSKINKCVVKLFPPSRSTSATSTSSLQGSAEREMQ